MASRAEREGWISEAPVHDAKRPRGRRLLRWTLWCLTLLVVSVAGFAGFLGYGTWAFAEQHADRILPGAVIAGVDVSGMTQAQAINAVEGALADHLAEQVVVRWQNETWPVSRAALGATTDAAEHVRRAVEASGARTWGELARMRWRGDLLGFQADVAITDIADAAHAFVLDIAHTIHRDPVDAAIEWETGWVTFHPEKTGLHVDVDGTVGDVLEAFAAGGGEVAMRVHEVQPETTLDDYRQVLLLRQADHRVFLYESGQMVASWPVAVGAAASGYPTPRGVFSVTLKRYMPTWVNPAPSGWGRGMPKQIGPGPNNPLGVRALNWSAPGAIRFHGTANVNSIGRNASKGCVRLTNADVVDLYDRVDEGATIISL